MSIPAPRLFLSTLVRQCKPKTRTSVRQPKLQRPSPTRNVHATHGFWQESYAQRYGPANEPRVPPPSNPDKSLPDPDELKAQPETGEKHDQKAEPGEKAIGQHQQESSSENVEATSESEGEHERRDFEETKRSGTPLDIVLKTPPPSVQNEDGHKHPHLAPSPYIHHFDTYSLVRDLAKGGYTDAQAVTTMKAIRTMLAYNLDVARESLVSKSDVENETYLFRAACSELRTSLQSSRQTEMQKQRSQRAQVQHEYDILNQKMTQDMLTLREDLKALFNDRKMASQEEKRRLDAKIQQLNYEITVTLNSDSKSQVEGLRWVLTRRAALAIGAAACK